MNNILNLDDLRKGYSGILPSWGDFMADCALYMFESQGHKSGVIFKVKTNVDTESYVVTWVGTMDFQMQRSMNDTERATDQAAMGLAILLVLHRTHYKGFTPAQKKTGIDFWLYEREPTDLDFTTAGARLEISGIRQESRTNTLEIRLRIKKKQAKQSAHTTKQIYFSITEFQKPSSIFVTE